MNFFIDFSRLEEFQNSFKERYHQSFSFWKIILICKLLLPNYVILIRGDFNSCSNSCPSLIEKRLATLFHSRHISTSSLLRFHQVHQFWCVCQRINNLGGLAWNERERCIKNDLFLVWLIRPIPSPFDKNSPFCVFFQFSSPNFLDEETS